MSRRIGLGAAATALVVMMAPTMAVASAAAIDQPGPALVDSELVVAQLTPAGLPENATLFDQLTAVDLPSATYRDPTSTTELRYVDQRGAPQTEGNAALITVGSDVPSVTTSSTFGMPLPIGLHAEYRRLGAAVEPEQVVDAAGTMVVVYTATNTTAEQQNISYTSAGGEPITERAPVFAPYVGTLRAVAPAGSIIREAPGAVLETDDQGRQTANWSLVLYPPLGDYIQTMPMTVTGDRLDIPQVTMEVVPVTSAEHAGTAFTADLLSKSVEGNEQLASGLDELNAAAVELAAGTAELSDGLAQLQEGNAELAAGLDDAYVGSAQLSAGLGALAGGANALAAALDQLAQRSSAAAPAQLDALAAALREVALLVGSPADPPVGFPPPSGSSAYQLVQALGTGVGRGNDELTAAGAALSQAQATIASVQSATQTAADKAAEAYGQLCAATPKPAGCDALAQAQTAIGEIASGTSQLDGQVADADSAVGTADQLGWQVASALGSLDSAISAAGEALRPDGGQFAVALAGLSQALNALNAAVNGVAAGAGAVANGVTALSNGSSELTAGLGDASVGADQLADGAAELSDGGSQIADGASQLQSDGTSRIYTEVVASSKDPAFAAAYLTATDARTTNAMPYGAPEGAVGRTAYLYTLEAPLVADEVNWGAVAGVAVAMLLLGLVAYRRISGPGPALAGASAQAEGLETSRGLEDVDAQGTEDVEAPGTEDGAGDPAEGSGDGATDQDRDPSGGDQDGSREVDQD